MCIKVANKRGCQKKKKAILNLTVHPQFTPSLGDKGKGKAG